MTIASQMKMNGRSGSVFLLVSLPLFVSAATPSVAVFDAEAPGGRDLAGALRDAGFSVRSMTPPLDETDAFDALAVADASAADSRVVEAVLDWIRRGRPALVLGAPLAEIARPPVLRTEAPLPKVARWDFAHGERGAATGTLSETNGTLHITFSPLLDWSVFTSSKMRVFAPGADTLCFEARAKEPSTDVQIELKDARGARWFHTIRLETEWRRFALYPGDFTCRTPYASPAFATVEHIAFALSPYTPRMAGRAADFELRGLGSAKASEQPVRLPFQDALYPHWKFADAGEFLTPVPRASGQGAFRGLRWRLVGTQRPQWTFLERAPGSPERAFVATGWKDPARNLAGETLGDAVRAFRRIVEEPVLFCAGTRHLAYHPGEEVRLGAEWRRGRTGGRLAMTVADPEGRTIWEKSLAVRPDATNACEMVWTAPTRPGAYRVKTRLGEDEIEQVFTVMSSVPDPEESFVTVKDGRFYANGREWHPIGVNYVPRYSAGLNPEDYRDAWMNDDFYDPAIVDEDLGHVAAMGGTFVAIQAPALSSNRNLVDFLRLARKHGLRVNLFVWELNPVDFKIEGWRRRAREIGLRNDSTIFAYDVGWELGFKVFDPARRGGARAKDWADWIDEEYGSVAAAEKAWGCAVWRDRDGRVTGPPQKCLMSDGPWRKETAAYRQFMDDFTSRAWNRARRFIKEEDPRHLVSYRQGNTVPHDFTFTGPVRHLDFIAPEGYMVTDTRHGEDVVSWVTRFAAAASGDRPIVWMEFSHDAWDRVTRRTLSTELEKAGTYAERFYRAGLASGAAGMTPWWWPGGFRYTECSDYGMVEPTGAERPLAAVFRTYAAPYAVEGRRFVPDVWMDFDRDAHPGGYWRAALNEGSAAWRRAFDGGHRLGVRLAGAGTDSANCEKRFLRGEFDSLEVTRVGDGMRVRAQLGNTGMAAWLPATAGKGGVSLVVRDAAGGRLAALPVTKRVERFGDTGTLEVVLPQAGTKELVLRLEAEDRGAFGERRRVSR